MAKIPVSRTKRKLFIKCKLCFWQDYLGVFPQTISLFKYSAEP